MTGDQARNEVLEALLSVATGDSDINGSAAHALPENLLTIVDSFGFVQLVAAIEERLGIELDLDGVDLADLVNSRSLVNFLQGHAMPTRLHGDGGNLGQIN